MKNALKWLDVNLEPLLMAFTFYVMTALVTLQVILRFGFNSGFAWGEEISRFIFVWLCFLAAGYISRNGRHIGVDVIRELFPPLFKKIMMIIVDMLTLFVLLLFLNASIDVLKTIVLFGDKGLTANISMAWLHAAPVVGYSLMCLRTIQNLVWKFRRFMASYDLFRNDSGLYSGANDIFFMPAALRAEVDDVCVNKTLVREEQQRKEGDRP